MFVPVTAQQIGTKEYNHVAGLLHVSAFFGHLREGIQKQQKIQVPIYTTHTQK